MCKLHTVMKRKKSQKKLDASMAAGLTQKIGARIGEDGVPEPEAFLDDAEKEPRRKLILDHTKTIKLLRDKKNFTFAAIADWFNQRGFQTDRSAVYRAYWLSIVPNPNDPDYEEHKEMEPD